MDNIKIEDNDIELNALDKQQEPNLEIKIQQNNNQDRILENQPYSFQQIDIEEINNEEQQKRKRKVEALQKGNNYEQQKSQNISNVIDNNQHYSQGEENYLGRSSMVRLNIDSTSKRKMNGIFCTLCILMMAVYLCTAFTPSSILSIQSVTNKCPWEASNPEYCQALKSTSFSLHANIIHGIIKKNQYMQVVADFQRITNPLDIDEYEQKVKYQVSIVYLNDDFSIQSVKIDKKQHEQTIKCHNKNQKSISKRQQRNRNPCDPIDILYLDQLPVNNYFFIVEILNESHLKTVFSSIKYDYITMNPSFTDFRLILRYFCLLVTIIVVIWYNKKMNQLPRLEWVIEQKMLFYMGPLLILFNDPFMAITLCVPNLISAFFSNLFQVLLVSYLMFFFLVCFHSILEDNNQKHTKVISKSKVILCVVFLIVSLVFMQILTLEFYLDPSSKVGSEYMNAILVSMVFYIFVVMFYLILLLSYYVRCCYHYKKMLNRYQIFFIFSSFFAFALAIFLISYSYHVHYMQSEKLLLTICITNIYIWFMKYFYMPSTRGLAEYADLKTYHNSIGNSNHIYQHIQDSQENIEDEEIVFSHKNI